MPRNPLQTKRIRPAGSDRTDSKTAKGADVSTILDATADTTPRCRRCHKPLRTELAIKIGLGGRCASLAIAHVTSGRVTAAGDGQQTLPLDVVEVVS